MAILLALLAASAFAMGSVLQQKGVLEAPAEGDDPRFLVQILKRPVWLAGGGLQATGWVLQAAALDRGSLVVVQSLTATSLVIALPLGAHFTDQQISRRVVTGAVAIIVGIVLFLSVGSPQKGTSYPTPATWVAAGALGTAVVVVLARIGRTRSGATKALIFGSAAGVGFAFQATVTKEFMTIVGNGIGDLFSSWEIYALIATAFAGFILQQSALKTGILAPAMASSNAVTLFASVVFGITVFGEKLSNGSNRLAPALIGLVIALAGVVLLAGTKPPQASEPIPFGTQV
ncbi:MAG: DMT family transporter [Acidimicrobiales bacterium]